MDEKPVATRRGARTAKEAPLRSAAPAAPKPGTDKPKPKEALPAALRPKATKLRELLVEAETGDSSARFEVSLLVKEVRDAPNMYGKKAVAQLGTEVGLGAATLYKYAAVGDCWTDAKAFREAAAQRTKRGRTLPWAVFLALAQEPDGRTRRGLHVRALADDLSAGSVRSDVASRKARKAASVAASMAALRRQAAALAENVGKTVSQATRDAGEVPGKALPAIRACIVQLARVSEAIPGAVEKLEALAQVVGAPHPEESD